MRVFPKSVPVFCLGKLYFFLTPTLPFSLQKETRNTSIAHIRIEPKDAKTNPTRKADVKEMRFAADDGPPLGAAAVADVDPVDVVEAGAAVVELEATDTDVAVALETVFADEADAVEEVIAVEAEGEESFPFA